jgi:hypothetical protein
LDSTRTIFTGHPDSEGCRRFDGNQASCLQAFVEGRAGVESCWYDAIDDECRGCGPRNLNDGFCTNTCVAAPTCGADPTRTFGACEQFDGNPLACNNSFQAGFDGPVSCVAFTRCSGCGLFNQGEGECSNTCFAGVGEGGNCSDGVDNDGDSAIDCGDSDCVGDPACTAPAPALSWPGLVALLLALGAVASYQFRRNRLTRPR